MSTRAQVASALASIGVLALGWQVGTANGQTLVKATPTTTTTTSGTTTTAASASASTSSTTTSSTTAASTTATGSSTGTSTTTAASGLKDGTFTGATSSNRYGSVTVTVTISGGKITTVNATANANDNHSAQINSRAVPVLKSETLSAQSASISSVSGATYTTNSYLSSLQSALDQAAA